MDADTYRHIWEGEYLQISDAQVLRGKFVSDTFTPGEDWDGPYFGADWGFSQDPTALVKCWIHGRRLYIEREVYEVGIEIDHLPGRFETIPGARQSVIRADSARPETISYLSRQGFQCVAAPKWAGSVEDGVAHLRGYDMIVIHPRCKNTLNEARLYRYKQDRLTGDILPVIVDANNHAIDAIRYALAPMIQTRQASGAGYSVRGL
jgi:phage terminase large subunit